MADEIGTKEMYSDQDLAVENFIRTCKDPSERVAITKLMMWECVTGDILKMRIDRLKDRLVSIIEKRAAMRDEAERLRRQYGSEYKSFNDADRERAGKLESFIPLLVQLIWASQDPDDLLHLQNLILSNHSNFVGSMASLFTTAEQKAFCEAVSKVASWKGAPLREEALRFLIEMVAHHASGVRGDAITSIKAIAHALGVDAIKTAAGIVPAQTFYDSDEDELLGALAHSMLDRVALTHEKGKGKGERDLIALMASYGKKGYADALLKVAKALDDGLDPERLLRAIELIAQPELPT